MRFSNKRAYTKKEKEAAKLIARKQDDDLEKVHQLFKAFGDHLLSESDVVDLLGARGARSTRSIRSALAALVGDGALEADEETIRPLDPKQTKVYRLAGKKHFRLQLIGIETKLSDDDTVIQCTCDGRLIRAIARVERLDVIAGKGAQRKEIESHVAKIAKGIGSGTPVPSAVILVALKDRVRESAKREVDDSETILVRPMRPFQRVVLPDRKIAQEFRPVMIDVPYKAAAFDGEKGMLLVDGQQRTAALSLVDRDKVPEAPMSMNIMVADDEKARTIFSIANNTVKIKTDLLRALVAELRRPPGGLVSDDQVPMQTVKALALEYGKSPFRGIVSYQGVQKKAEMVVAQNALFEIVRLFAGKFEEAGIGTQRKTLVEAIAKSFDLVKRTWPEEWGKRATESKLMHSGGLSAVSQVLVRRVLMLYSKYGSLSKPKVWSELASTLARLKDVVAWSQEAAVDGTATAKRNWKYTISRVQVTPQDIKALAEFLEMQMVRVDAAHAGRR